MNITGSTIHNLYLNGILSNSNWHVTNGINVITIGNIRNIEIDYKGAIQSSLSDSLSLSDSISKQPIKSLSESVGISDSVTKTIMKSLSDSLALSASISNQPKKSLTDSLATFDSMTTSASKHQSLSESLSILDSITSSVTRHQSLSESISISDSLTTSVGRTALLLDSVSLSELLSTTASLHIPLSDSLSMSDSMNTGVGRTISLSDSLSISEMISTASSFHIPLYESISIYDSILNNLIKAQPNTGESSYTPQSPNPLPPQPPVTPPVQPPQEQPPLPSTFNVHLAQSIFKMQIGDYDKKPITVIWDTPNDLTINDIQANESLIPITFEKGPITLGKTGTVNMLYFIARLPNNLPPNIYHIPVTITATSGNTTVLKTETISIDTRQNPILDNLTLLLILFGLIGMGISSHLAIQHRRKHQVFAPRTQLTINPISRQPRIVQDVQNNSKERARIVDHVLDSNQKEREQRNKKQTKEFKKAMKKLKKKRNPND